MYVRAIHRLFFAVLFAVPTAGAEDFIIDAETGESTWISAVTGVMRDFDNLFSVGVTGHAHAFGDAAAWGAAFEAWSGDQISLGSGDPHLFGLESSVIAQSPHSSSVKAPIFTTFKTRPDGSSYVQSAEPLLNRFNTNSSHIFADAQPRDGDGVYSAAHSIVKATRWAVDRTVNEPYAAGLDWRQVTRLGHPYDEAFYFTVWAHGPQEFGVGWDAQKQAFCFYSDIKVEDASGRIENFCIDMASSEESISTASLQLRLEAAEARISELEALLEELLSGQ